MVKRLAEQSEFHARQYSSRSSSSIVATSLTFLNLGANRIGDEGSAAIVRALEKNSFVTSLLLGYNNVGAGPAAAVEMAVLKNVAQFKNFARHLLKHYSDNDGSSLKFNIHSYNRLKYCDKRLLAEAIGEDNAAKLVKHYIDSKYASRNFLQMLGVCKPFANWSERAKGESAQSEDCYISRIPMDVVGIIGEYVMWNKYHPNASD